MKTIEDVFGGKLEKSTINMPIGIVKGDNAIHIFPTSETEQLLGKHLCGISGSGKTIEEAETKFFAMLRALTEYESKRSSELDLYKPFQKGNWKQTGGSWFKTFGITVYFRYGKGMKGGTYIPFTKLNVSISNKWTTRNK